MGSNTHRSMHSMKVTLEPSTRMMCIPVIFLPSVCPCVSHSHSMG